MQQKSFGNFFSNKLKSKEIGIEIIYDLDQLYAARKEWLKFEGKVHDPLSYFQCYDWCEKWCRIFAPQALSYGGSLHIAFIRRNGQLAAILPLVIENRKRVVKVLRFLGEPMIQYAKILLDPDLLNKTELRECVKLISRNANCDTIYLDHMVEGSPLNTSLDAEHCYSSNQSYACAISLKEFEDGDAYRASLTRPQRKSRNRKRRKLESKGNVSLCVVDGHDPSFQKFCEIALEQKRIWLENTGKPSGKISDSRMKRMLGELGADVGSQSGAIAFVLLLDNKPIAIEIGFWRKDHYYSFLGSYEWSMAEFSPGKLLLEDAIIWCIDNKFAVYDLLGNPTPYKEALANHRIPLIAYAHGKTIIGNVYARYWRPRVKPSIKQTLATLPIQIRQMLFSA
ncbi:MAG: GNAT family N-acetyltransferase, partial [Salaquimonas sp.]